EAFKSKKQVVTSNIELVATYGAQLIRTARENDVAYLFEASVGGGIPIIRPLNNCLVANEIHEIMGILNGTTNYILTQMIQTGQSFERALSDAQQKGYAERDPMADIEGIDTCRKIAILSALCYGRQIDSDTIPTQGISNIDLQDVFYSEKNGYTIKLIGRSKKVDGNVYVKVSPLLLPKKHPLAGVEDVFNAILVRASATGDLMFYGKGAGKMPTASAVVADCINIIKYGNLGMPVWENGGVVSRCNCDNIKYYIRVKSEDKADTKEQINSLFAKAVWLDTQENDVAFITDKDDENNILDNIQKLRSLIGNDNVKATYQVED
ncbi:MAG: homoserine dehydrogenase, partial [Clostridiaceae bacterium]|nr:homoserine dehydrogenase [Clostridiaceae bacterium]